MIEFAADTPQQSKRAINEMINTMDVLMGYFEKSMGLERVKDLGGL